MSPCWATPSQIPVRCPLPTTQMWTFSSHGCKPRGTMWNTRRSLSSEGLRDLEFPLFWKMGPSLMVGIYDAHLGKGTSAALSSVDVLLLSAQLTMLSTIHNHPQHLLALFNVPRSSSLMSISAFPATPGRCQRSAIPSTCLIQRSKRFEFDVDSTLPATPSPSKLLFTNSNPRHLPSL